MSQHRHHIVIQLVLLLVIGIGSSAILLPNLDTLTIYEGDESLWLTVSHKLFRLYAIEHDVDHPDWQKEYSTFGSRQPQIGKYIIGFGTSFVPFDGEPEAYSWRWNESWDWNMANRVPPLALVANGRRAIAVMGVIASLAFYWLVRLVTNTFTGLIAVASLLGARLLISVSRVTLIDTPALAFSLLTLIGMIYLLRALRSESGTKKALIWALPTGIAAGLAVGTKLNTLLMLFVCIAALMSEALVTLRNNRQRTYTSLIALSIIIGWVAIIVYGSNPFLYGQPIAGVRHLLELSAMVAGIPFEQLTTYPARVAAVWRNTEIYAPLHTWGFSGDRWLILFGLLALVATIGQGGRQLRARQLDLMLMWIIITYVGITLWLPHDWQRYYLPLQPCNAFLQAYGIFWLGTTLWQNRHRLPWYSPRNNETTTGSLSS